MHAIIQNIWRDYAILSGAANPELINYNLRYWCLQQAPITASQILTVRYPYSGMLNWSYKAEATPQLVWFILDIPCSWPRGWLISVSMPHFDQNREPGFDLGITICNMDPVTPWFTSHQILRSKPRWILYLRYWSWIRSACNPGNQTRTMQRSSLGPCCRDIPSLDSLEFPIGWR